MAEPAAPAKAVTIAGVRSACAADAKKHCDDVIAGGGRVYKCLKGRESDLAPDCKGQFNRVKNDTTVTQ